MQVQGLLELIIEALMLCVGGMMAYVFKESKDQITKLTESVSELNYKMARVVEQLSNHHERIDNIEVYLFKRDTKN